MLEILRIPTVLTAFLLEETGEIVSLSPPLLLSLYMEMEILSGFCFGSVKPERNEQNASHVCCLSLYFVASSPPCRLHWHVLVLVVTECYRNYPCLI